jgi:hypothetical protein
MQLSEKLVLHVLIKPIEFRLEQGVKQHGPLHFGSMA